MTADLIVHNGRITTLAREGDEVAAVAIEAGKIVAVGSDAEVVRGRGPATLMIDAQRRRVIPGLIDSHIHVIRGGLNFTMELRWDGLPSLADAMRRLRDQARRTPAPQWVRVIGGWNELQFAERRMPTLDEINAVAPDTPVFILHLYDRALLNRAALHAVGYTKDTPDPPGAIIERDARGNPTGALIAQPNAALLYATLGRGPKLSTADQRTSTLLFMRELNRFGLTSAIDAGGGAQSYPDDYAVIEDIARAGELTLRLAYNLFAQRPAHEREELEEWSQHVRPGLGDDLYRFNGAGEMLVYAAADFEDFRAPRPELGPTMESQLEAMVEELVTRRWPFRMHATYDETVVRALDVIERVNARHPLGGLRWWFDHAETIGPRSIDRVAALGGGIAVQHRMAYQGEYFVQRYGAEAARQAPPVRRILEAGVPIGAGTDATRVASYNPWVALSWLVTGKTVGGLELTTPAEQLDREAALRLFTTANGWFSGEETRKGALVTGQLGDLAILTDDYFAVPPDRIRDIEAALTVLGGKVVHASGPYADLAPPLPPSSPAWSPVDVYGGYGGQVPGGCSCLVF